MKQTIVLLLLAALSTAPLAEEAPLRAPKRCSAFIAEQATVRQIAQDAARFEGRCVQVEGVMQGRDLYADVDGIYLRPKEPGNPSSNGARLGLDNIPGHYSEAYRHVSVVGRVQDCEHARACLNALGDAVLIMGYCHNESGAYLWVEKISRQRGKAFERQMGSAARADYGDLAPAPDDWRHRQQVESLADTFLAALRSADRPTLSALHFGNVDNPEEPEVLDFLLKEPHSPFAALRAASSEPQRAVLVERSMLASTAAEDADNYAATVCFCRRADCAGHWPIAKFDADNLPTRPYACTEIGPYYTPPRGWVPHFATAAEVDGLAEPPWRQNP